jgi:putative ABC transport system permease protein
MGAAAGLFALPLGTLLAAVMIHVVNRRSFGWSMELAFAPAPLVEAFALALIAALGAGLLPARRLAAADPALGLREE